MCLIRPFYLGAALAACVAIESVAGTDVISREAPRRLPPASAQVGGTACVFGELPAPACLRYQDQRLEDACIRPTATVARDCVARRTDLPLPPRDRRALMSAKATR